MAALGRQAGQSIRASVLEESVASVYADSGLVEAVVQRRPSLLALTLYVWNVQRSLLLAARVKARLPDTRVLVGGPEATRDNEWLLRHPAVDAGVFGEGESRIQGVVAALAQGRSLADIPGTFCVQDKARRLNLEEPLPWDLAACSYPYLDRVIGPSRTGTLFLETVRGCPFQCRYCYYHKAYKSVRPHPRRAVEDVIRWAYQPDSQVAELYLMDPSFNLSPHYRDVLRLMAQLRPARDIRGHTELRAEFLDDEDPARLSEAGVASVEIGLQSVNPKALALAGRSSRIARIARAVERLKKESIEVTTGIILGLPGDRPEDFQKTLDWLKTTDAYTVVHPFLLSVLPGTDFRQRAGELGLTYDPRPPYYVQATPCFAEDELRDAMLACETTFDMELDHIDLPCLVDHAPDLTVSLDAADYLSKWIVDPAKKTWRQKLAAALTKAADPFIFWFRGADCRGSEDDITRILDAFFDANPHAFVHVVFEYPTRPRPRFLQRLAARTAQPATYVNKSMQSWIKGTGVLSPAFTILVHDPLEQGSRRRILGAYEDLATIVWDIGAPDQEIISQAAGPCLVSAAVKPGSPYGYHLLRTLRQRFRSSPEEVLFRDNVLQQFWLRSTNQWQPQGFPERIVMDVD